MGEAIRKLGNTEVEALARIVAECMTGSQMNGIFQECGVRDTSNEVQNGKGFTILFITAGKGRIIKCFSEFYKEKLETGKIY